MFEQIGSKIKGLATFLTVAGIFAGVILWISLMAIDEDLALIGILAGVAIAVLSWISSFVLFGFGELVENSNIIAIQMTEEGKRNASLSQSKIKLKESALSQEDLTKISELKKALKERRVSEETYNNAIAEIIFEEPES